MADGFSAMIEASRAFFTELATNNTREWFEPRKERYQTEIRKPAELLSELFAQELSRLTGKAHKPRVYRINRDVRFSKDKRPYNAHLHILWTQGVEGASPGWFFGVSPEYLQFATGIMSFEGDTLDQYRKLVDQRGDELVEALKAVPGATIGDWGEEPLKRAPKPYADDHPHADMLKRKNLILSVQLTNSWDADGVLTGLQRQTEALLPFWRIMEEGLG